MECNPLVEAEQIADRCFREREEQMVDVEDWAFELTKDAPTPQDIEETLNLLADEAHMSFDERKRLFANVTRRIRREHELRDRVNRFLATHYEEYRGLSSHNSWHRRVYVVSRKTPGR